MGIIVWKGEQTGGDAIRGAKVGRTLAPAIEDQQLMPDQRGFGINGTESARPCQSDHGDDHMNEQEDEVTHPGNGNNTSQATVFRPIGQFAMDRSRCVSRALYTTPLPPSPSFWMISQ